MPRLPALRFCKTNRRWRTTLKYKTYWFSKDYGESVQQYADAYRKVYGRDPAIQTPITVASLVLVWLREHGYCTGPDQGGWTKREKWGHDMLLRFADFTGETHLDDLKNDVLVKYHAWCVEKEFALNTIRHYVSFAARALAWANDNEFINLKLVKPKMVKPRYVPRDVSMEELGEFLRKMEANTRREGAARIARFILETGARPIEARLLQWRHVRLDARTCHLMPDEHKTGKRTGESRTLYLTEDAIELLESIRPAKATPDDYVFLSGKGRPYSRDGLRAIFKRAGVYPYQLRHVYAQNFVDQGGDIGALQVAMGHKSAATTAVYSQVRAQRVLNALSHVESASHRASRVQRQDASAQKKKVKKKSKRRSKSQQKTQKPAKARRRRA